MGKKLPPIDAKVKTEGDLYVALLQQNRGIVFAEHHGGSKDVESLAKYCPILKKQGKVDTIYTEMGKDVVATFNRQSLTDLKAARQGLIDVKRDNPEFYKEYKLAMEQVSKLYGGKISAETLMDKNIKCHDLAISARENGVRLVSMERTEAEMAKQMLDLPERVRENNNSWVKEIEKDRKKIDPKGQGNFIIHGGFIHFANTPYGKGTVAEHFQIPVVSHTQSVLPAEMHSKGFYKGDNPNGADFYIPAGPSYPNLKQFILKPGQEYLEQEKASSLNGKKTSQLSPETLDAASKLGGQLAANKITPPGNHVPDHQLAGNPPAARDANIKNFPHLA